MKRILCVGLDTFSRKNITQVESAYEGGFYFDVFCNDSRGKSEELFAPYKSKGAKIYSVKKNLLVKLYRFIKCLVLNQYHHVELYPAGRMGFLYVIILKLMNQKILVIERGDIGCLDDYNPLTKFSIFLSYKLATGIIYKEVYMKKLLLQRGAKRLYFLPNCVPEAPSGSVTNALQKSGFLWVNRVISQRRAHWLSEAFSKPLMAHHNLDIVGISSSHALTNPKINAEIITLQHQAKNIFFHEIQEPFEYYNTRRFFCLPSQLVFGNNSLLEAMSYGLIPIVTYATGIELLIEDGINGIITDMNKEAYFNGLQRAASLSENEVYLMSEAARKTVLDNYGVKKWTKKLLEIYESD